MFPDKTSEEIAVSFYNLAIRANCQKIHPPTEGDACAEVKCPVRLKGEQLPHCYQGGNRSERLSSLDGHFGADNILISHLDADDEVAKAFDILDRKIKNPPHNF